MSHAAIARSYPSLEAFYAADRRRRHSRERNVGLLWRGRGGSTFRAAWIQETGEVYLFRHGWPPDGGGTVDLVDRLFGLGELHAAIRGYGAVCGRRDSLAWFLDRVSGRQLAAAA
jgi:hypothetical protein